MSGKSEDSIDVAYVANLARLRLSDEETQMFQEQLQDIVGYVQKVNELDVSDVEPTAHGIPVQNVFRKDEKRDSLPHAEVMSNAPAELNEQFQVPKIVE